MKQVVQTMRDGHLRVEEVPAPELAERFVLVETISSVISAGTEKTKVDMGKKSLLEKARARPDLVKQVLQKVRSDGFAATLRTVNARLDSAAPLGYSSAGRVLAIGREVVGVRPGDLVACAGAGYANHAEVVAVPRNLVARVPDGVAAEEAAFATLGSIALQGVRLADPKLGETVLVIGLGLLGQIAVQLLGASGCKVIGSDLATDLCNRAAAGGVLAMPPGAGLVDACRRVTKGHGVDAVLICAGTSSNEPIELAGSVVRERGRVVVVGAVGMTIPREPYFKTEASIVISRSYGPGRYDPAYEESGHDYPYGYVRFTEQRNLETFLDLVAARRIDVSSLITHRFRLEDAVDAYALIEGEKREPYLGIVLEYAHDSNAVPVGPAKEKSVARVEGDGLELSLYGAGNYATATLLPSLVEAAKSEPGLVLDRIATPSGRSAWQVGEKFGFREAVSTLDELLAGSCHGVMIATRHGNHAAATLSALAAGKHVYVEKPLALTLTQCWEIAAALERRPDLQLLVGFNRRFSPLVEKAREHLRGAQPMVISVRVNAGRIPSDSWIHDPEQGGGRLIGEGCHFIDLISAIADSPIVRVTARAARVDERSALDNDNVVVTVELGDGSIGAVIYESVGPKAVAKEYIEVFGGGRAAIIDDFKELRLYEGDRTVSTIRLPRQDKGQTSMLRAWLSALRSGRRVVSSESLLGSSIAAIRAVESIAVDGPLTIDLRAPHN